MSRTVTIKLGIEQHLAITAALASGALHERMAMLRSLLNHNRDHYSIANNIEREIQALTDASVIVLAAQQDADA